MQQVSKCDVYQVNEVCECGGMFYPTQQNITLTSYSPLFQHQCSKCGKLKSFYQRYPTMKLVPTEPLHPIEDIIQPIESNPTTDDTIV